MERISRAGRKAQMKRVLIHAFSHGKNKSLRAGDVARKIGMTASTNVKKMLDEMVDTDDDILIYEAPTGRRYMYRPHEQMTLPERFITINGAAHRVANWVSDFRGVKNVE